MVELNKAYQKALKNVDRNITLEQLIQEIWDEGGLEDTLLLA